MSERGASDGRKDQPPPEAARLTETETAIVSRVEGAMAQSAKEMLGVSSPKEFMSLPQELESLAAEPQTILTQFRAKKARAQSAVQIELDSAHTDFARSYRDYRQFRVQHALTETEPSYDTVFWRKVFWLALLFCIEVAANGWVIGQASPGGLVQGWTTALMISVLVVLTGTLIGVGPWRYLNYGGVEGRGAQHRVWAIPSVVVGGLLLVFLAFYVAHYRYAIATAPLDSPVPGNILTSITTQPFAPFEQLESFALFVIALLIGIFAVARGAHWDDPYPGYGPRHRRMEDARERSQSLALGLSREVDAAKDGADGAMHAIAGKMQDTIGALKRALASTQDNASAWDSSVNAIIGAGRDGIALYRGANRSTRGVREPAYFADDPLDGIAPQSSAALIAGLEAAIARSTSNITQCKSQLAGARAQLEAEYQSFYDDELTPFLKGIQDGASAKVRDEFIDPPKKRSALPAIVDSENGEVLPLKRGGAA